MSDATNPLEEAIERSLDAFVYAPIGLLFEGPDRFPDLVRKGKDQVNTARMLGQFAVQTGQGEAEKAIEKGRKQLLEALSGLGAGAVNKPSAAGSATPTGTSTAKQSTKKTAPAKKATKRKPAKKATAKKRASGRAKKRASKKTSAPTATGLAIPDYDGLSASQVVSRLGGLSPKELRAVGAYEEATRGRKTILNKVAQLEA